MSGKAPITNVGVTSLSGFAYQIKAFLLYLSQITEEQQVEFESLDDITITDVASNDRTEDSCLKRIKDSAGNIVAIQVKQTNVTPAVCRKVLYNWLLALKVEPALNNFVLCVEDGRSISETVFFNGAKQEFNIIMNSNDSAIALTSRVKKIYHEDFEQFQKDYNFICNHRKIKRLSIDSELAEILTREFHATAGTVGPVFFRYRIEELFHRICAEIIDCALQRKPYICTNNRFEQICEEICKRISNDCFEPDYNAFVQNVQPFVENEELRNCREYRQLEHCKLPIPKILDHIRWEQYYANIRQYYLLDACGDKITTTETVAHENHCSVVMELKDENRDTPLQRLLQTKKQPISTLTNELSRWGAYVYLTKEGALNQISWKDDDPDE